MNTEAIEDLDTMDCAETRDVSDPSDDRSPWDRGDPHLEFLRRISGRLAVADPLHEVLDQIVEFLNAVIGADSCFVYLLEEHDLVLRASKNPHPESRLIGVLNLQHQARHEHSQHEINLVSTIGHLVGAEVERARLDSEVAKLTGQLQTRKLLERAKGILQRDLSVTEEQAYLKLQQESRRRRIPMKQVAEAVVLSDDLRRPQPG